MVTVERNITVALLGQFCGEVFAIDEFQSDFWGEEARSAF